MVWERCVPEGPGRCSGGLMDNAFTYYKSNAVCTEESYPYQGAGGTCRASACTDGIPARLCF